MRPAPNLGFLVLALSAALLLAMGCRETVTDSQLDSLDKGVNVGNAYDRHGKTEVLIYYANETAPSGEEATNYSRMIAALDKHPKTKFIAERLLKDTHLFPLIVDKETKDLKDNLCSRKNKTGTALIIFTNRGVRNGVIEYCRNGGEVKTLKYDYIGYLKKYATGMEGDFRAENNPLANLKSLERALEIVRWKFVPTRYLYNLVTKSHGNPTHFLIPRLLVRTDKVSADEIAAELLEKLPEVDDAGASPYGSVTAKIKKNSEELEASTKAIIEHLLEVAGRNRNIRNELFGNELVRNELLKNELLKNELFKNDLLKSELLKNALIKNELLKNELIKNELVKNELIKNELLKNELFKNELIKNELLKNELIKNELFKNELFKNELIKNELVKNELVKNELLKNELVKNELLKNELVKNELLKNELLKNELLKNELVKNELAKEALLKNELTKEHLAADGETAGSSTETESKIYQATNPKIGVSKDDYLKVVVGSGFNPDKDKDMYFSVVFTESCSSYLEWNHLLDFGESAEAAKIDWMFSSDKGSLGYSTINYEEFLNDVSADKPFGEQLKDLLNKTAVAQKAMATR